MVFPSILLGNASGRLGEACEIIKRMWTETSPSFEGRYYQIKDAYCEPKPIQKPTPPFVIGGSGEKLTLRIVAQYANIWNCVGSDVENFQQKSAILDTHCAAIGRDPKTIERSVQLMVDPGNMEATRDLTRSFIEAGATHLIMNLRMPYPKGIVHRIGEEIVEPLKAEFEER